MARNYHTLRAGSTASEKQLNTFLMKNGQQLLPMVQLIEQSRVAIDELVDTIGRVTIDTILEMSAEQVAGPRQQGRWRRDQHLVWYGKQPGQIYLSDRKLTVNKPRLRRRGTGADKEIPIPAYVALRDRAGMQRRMLELLMNGVSTRSYKQVIPQMADSVGISKSTVSQQTIVAAEQALADLLARRLERQRHSGGVHRRAALWRILRDWSSGRRCRRAENRVGHSRGSDGKCGRLQRPAGGPGGARIGS